MTALFLCRAWWYVPRMNAEYWIEKLNLNAHPEGGFFRETYRSSDIISSEGLPERFSGERSCSTAIYFLVLNGNPSRLHRLKGDEVWHFYDGDPLDLVVLYPDGRREDIRLGRDLDAGQVLQAVIPAGCWFGGNVHADGEYTLAGCTVAPGFDFEDFEMGRESDLLVRFPQHSSLVHRLAAKDS